MKIKLVEIWWHDASSLTKETSEWLSIDGVKEIGKEVFDEGNLAAGYIVEKNKNYILVCATTVEGREESEMKFADCSMIPIGMVKSIKYPK